MKFSDYSGTLTQAAAESYLSCSSNGGSFVRDFYPGMVEPGMFSFFEVHMRDLTPGYTYTFTFAQPGFPVKTFSFTYGTVTGSNEVSIGASTPFSWDGSTNNASPWYSSNPSVATVNPVTGVVTGVSAGVATIYYNTYWGGFDDGYPCNKTITVNATVTFNNNTGSGVMANQVALAPAALTSNTFTKLGYRFTGWNTAANGSGTAYADGATYSFAADITMYAQWLIDNHTVTFDNNTGSGVMTNQVASSPAALTSNTFTKLGYHFTGWNTAANGSGTAFADGATYSFVTNVTLYAQWAIDVVTSIATTSCGQTLTAMGSLVYANINWSATAYRFKVVNNTTGAIQYVDNTHHWFALNWLASYDYATQYTVSVQLQIAGVWLGYYGSSCTVSTPAVNAPGGSLQLIPSQCGADLPSIGTVISTTPQSGATGYRFRITDVTPGATGSNLVQIKERSYHWFTLPMLNRYNYGSTYMVEVAVKTTGGYSAYGSACMVNTPAVPMLASCGAVVPTAGSLVYTTSMNSVTQYRFEVTKVSDQTILTFDSNKYWFSFRVNVPGYSPNTAYSVRIAVMTGGTWSAFGDACTITSPAAATRTDDAVSPTFEALAFPNPFSKEFKLNVTTSTEGAVELRVYDMLGKLLEARTIHAIDFISEDFGTNYPAGVYNVIVTQGENVKTLRVIKR